MKLPSTLLVLLLLSACATTGALGTNPICGIQQPTVSEKDTDATIIELDNYLARVNAACKQGGGHHDYQTHNQGGQR